MQHALCTNTKEKTEFTPLIPAHPGRTMRAIDLSKNDVGGELSEGQR